MTSPENNKSRVEIISPAGNFDKLRFALNYGADAVYFGGEEFNLRTQAGNFTFDEISESLDLCKNQNIKTIFLMNSFLHEDDLIKARDYIARLKNFNFHAVMVSDPGMLLLLKEAGVPWEIHLSTQMNTLNHMALKFWEKAGIKRVVLGRETTLGEIQKIRDNSDMELEIFIHGALCIAYSGRCLLSRYLSGRDANQGDCSQSCRWKYSLIEEKRPGSPMDIIEHANGTEILSSKDLCCIAKVRDFIKAGVKAFKIEGRMKSIYYTANTTRVYKHAVINAGLPDFESLLPFWERELDLINHRPYTDNLFNEFNNTGFTGIPYVKKALFLGYMAGKGSGENQIYVKVFNPIYLKDEIDGIFPIINNKIRDDKFIVKNIFDNKNRQIEMARPGETFLITFDKKVNEDALFRKIL